MADEIELKNSTPDSSIDENAVLIGADTASSTSPVLFSLSTILAYIRSLSNTWAGTQTFSGAVNFEQTPSFGGGAFYYIGGTNVAIADGGTNADTASGARTNLGLAIGSDVQAHSAVLDGTTASYTTAEETKLAGIEALADVTDTAKVTAAGALMDSEVDANIKTFALPASTTISAFGATIVDDANAPSARTTLGLGTGDTPQFTGVNIGNADTSITRASAGDINVDGNVVYRAGGTNVSITDGGTGANTADGARSNLGLGTGDNVRFNFVEVGEDDTVRGLLYIYGGGTSAGGQIRLYSGSDSDATVNFFNIDTVGGQLRFGRNGSPDITLVDSGDFGLGTGFPTVKLDIVGNAIRIRQPRTPASSSATGATGEISWDASYIYVCTSTNTWKRAALSTW